MLSIKLLSTEKQIHKSLVTLARSNKIGVFKDKWVILKSEEYLFLIKDIAQPENLIFEDRLTYEGGFSQLAQRFMQQFDLVALKEN